MEWTKEAIEALPKRERLALLQNAQRQATPEARKVLELIANQDAVTRPYDGLRRDHPTVQAMETIIRSTAARVGARQASDAGLPALAGVEELLIGEIGSRYGGPDTTNWAGILVAEVMEEAGYLQTKKRPMPLGSIAKTAAFFEPRS